MDVANDLLDIHWSTSLSRSLLYVWTCEKRNGKHNRHNWRLTRESDVSFSLAYFHWKIDSWRSMNIISNATHSTIAWRSSSGNKANDMVAKRQERKRWGSASGSHWCKSDGRREAKQVANNRRGFGRDLVLTTVPDRDVTPKFDLTWESADLAVGWGLSALEPLPIPTRSLPRLPWPAEAPVQQCKYWYVQLLCLVWVRSSEVLLIVVSYMGTDVRLLCP